jgi:hypothetical protein
MKLEAMSKKNNIITSKMLAHIAVSPALGSQARR